MFKEATIVGLEYPGGSQHPLLLVQEDCGDTQQVAARFQVNNYSLLTAIKRTLATGDRVRCLIQARTDGAFELVEIQLLVAATLDPGRPRHLNIQTTSRDNSSEEAELAEGPGEVEGELYSKVTDEGEPIVEADFPYDTAQVCRWRGKYFYSNDAGLFGPYATLDDALDDNWPGFPAWAQAVTCSEMTSMELVERLTAAIDNPKPGLTIELNGQEWVFDQEKRWIPGSAS